MKVFIISVLLLTLVNAFPHPNNEISSSSKKELPVEKSAKSSSLNSKPSSGDFNTAMELSDLTLEQRETAGSVGDALQKPRQSRDEKKQKTSSGGMEGLYQDEKQEKPSSKTTDSEITKRIEKINIQIAEKNEEKSVLSRRLLVLQTRTKRPNEEGNHKSEISKLKENIEKLEEEIETLRIKRNELKESYF